MTPGDEPRHRMGTTTIPEMVPLIEVDRRFHAWAQQLRQEFVANIDRQALERARDEATKAVDQIAAARTVSQHRYTKLIIAHGITVIVIAGVIGAMAMQFAYASTNRDRIERLEQQMDAPP